MSQQSAPAETEAIFEEAIGLQGHARADYLDASCGVGTPLRTAIEDLLRAHDEAGSFLSDPNPPRGDEAGGSSEGALAPIEAPGGVVGRYKLLERIGEGGFGVVFMAEQTRPVRRRVALKILRVGMETDAAIARFEAERQALALMDHPNIATVFDGGVTETSRPYIVMELVRGEPINEFCDNHKLSVRDRLDLFCQVARAIEHAHHKGIIHRDIKPSNVVVTLSGDRPISKVIDFGIAKAMHTPLTDRTLYTGFKQLIGTPIYMSPEQASSGSVDPDTRSDVYSLGVVLYEMLVGSTPIAADTFREAEYGEMQRLIRDTDAPAPSTRLRSREDAATIAASRATEPSRLSAAIRGDLDWIVLKCLEKDRARRYQTAGALVEDIERFLRDEPVVARPPSAIYKLRKFVRRNRAGVISAAIVALAVGAAFAGTASGFVWALGERERAAAALDAERLSRAEAQELGGLLIDVLTSPDPARSGRTVTVVDVLDDARGRLLDPSVEIDETRLTLMVTLGRTYLALGEPDAAMHLLERAHGHLAARGAERAQMLACVVPLAGAALALGEPVEALRVSRSHLPTSDTPTRALAERWECERMLVEAEALLELDRAGDAIETFEAAEEPIEELDRPELKVRRLVGIGQAMLRDRRPSEAEGLFTAAAEVGARELGDEHPATLEALRRRAVALREFGRSDESRELLGRLYGRNASRFGLADARTLTVAADLMEAAADVTDGDAVSASGITVDVEFASRSLERAVALANDHPARARTRDAASRLLRTLGEADHPMLGATTTARASGESFEDLYFLGREQLNVGRPARAVTHLTEAIAAGGDVAPSSFRWIDAHLRLIRAHLDLERLHEARLVTLRLLESAEPRSGVLVDRLLESVGDVLLSLPAGDEGAAPVIALLTERSAQILGASEWDTGRDALTRIAMAAADRGLAEAMEDLMLARRRVFLADHDTRRTEQEREAIERLALPWTPTEGSPAGGLVFDGNESVVLVPGFQWAGPAPITFEAIITPGHPSNSYSAFLGWNETAGFALGVSSEYSDEYRYDWCFYVGEDVPHAARLGYAHAMETRPIELGRRTHVAGIWDGSAISLYVDGVLVGRQEDVPRMGRLPGLPLCIGAGPSWEKGTHHHFRGVIYEARIRASADAPSEGVTTLEATPDTISLYDLTRNTGDRVPDLSGNGYHGAVFDAAWLPPAENEG